MRILMVSDFFHPNVGGIETHIYNLSQSLIRLGHKVVVYTHMYGRDRCGVRHLGGGLKVYYIPRLPFYKGTTFPTIYGTLRLFRVVTVRERIDVVHCHQTFSTLALECLWHARTMGLRTVFTDHSLDGFADMSSILMNKLLKLGCANASALICVSHVAKENTVLRGSIAPSRVFVIPNAVHTSVFSPERKLRAMHLCGRRHIIVVSRLVYRRGIDLLAQVIARACATDPAVRFTIVGDGPKRGLLEYVVRRDGLEDRVHLLGSLPHEQVVRVLEQANVFLNLSLTEAFGMAMLEAASVGLLVVSTAVGGVPEIFPAIHQAEDGCGMLLCNPELESAVAAVREALAMLPRTREQITRQHALVERAFNWESVGRRTERVYASVCEGGREGGEEEDALYVRLVTYSKLGRFFGPIVCACTVLLHAYVWCLERWIQPMTSIEVARDLVDLS